MFKKFLLAAVLIASLTMSANAAPLFSVTYAPNGSGSNIWTGLVGWKGLTGPIKSDSPTLGAAACYTAPVGLNMSDSVGVYHQIIGLGELCGSLGGQLEQNQNSPTHIGMPITGGVSFMTYGHLGYGFDAINGGSLLMFGLIAPLK